MAHKKPAKDIPDIESSVSQLALEVIGAAELRLTPRISGRELRRELITAAIS